MRRHNGPPALRKHDPGPKGRGCYRRPVPPPTLDSEAARAAWLRSETKKEKINEEIAKKKEEGDEEAWINRAQKTEGGLTCPP